MKYLIVDILIGLAVILALASTGLLLSELPSQKEIQTFIQQGGNK